jgi:hypothetical protein
MMLKRDAVQPNERTQHATEPIWPIDFNGSILGVACAREKWFDVASVYGTPFHRVVHDSRPSISSTPR